MQNKTTNLILIALSLFLSNTYIYSQQNDGHHTLEAKDHWHKHHIAIFNGATTNFSHRTTSYTIGLDYEYRVSQWVGLGLLAEYITSKPEEILAGVSVFVHPYKGMKFIAAPLIVFLEEPHGQGELIKETEFAFRIGAGYDFHVHNLAIGPSVNFDFGKTNAINYGISVGVGF